MKTTALYVDRNKLPGELRAGMDALAAAGEYADLFARRKAARAVRFRRVADLGAEGGLRVTPTADAVEVLYRRSVDAFRALGIVRGHAAAGRVPPVAESTPFSLLGAMFECSRNGVLACDAVEALLRRCALMGVNLAMLYTEDTYTVPGEPFFGYLRGRYTPEELRRLDDYAAALGIEMMPCIQALAHLEQALQWDAYRKVRDTAGILLAGDPATYALVEKMLAAASAPFRSRRIHLGMDEAHGLGTGRYRALHGERRTFDIMNEHLRAVAGLCRKMGLRPMMWSDMFFRIGSKSGDYYDLQASIPDDVKAGIPKDVDLVYWDYYHDDYAFYAQFIDLHRALGKEPVMAPGAWNWNRFWTALPYSYRRLKPCLDACRDKGVKEAFITTWGDDGMENDIFSSLPALQYYADLGYAAKGGKAGFAARFRGSCSGDAAAYERASDLDLPTTGVNSGRSNANAAKWLLWDDPLIGLCEPLQEGRSFRAHYRRLATDLAAAAARDGATGRRLRFPARLARVLALKCDCRKNLVAAYRRRDRAALRRLLRSEVTPLIAETRALWKEHRTMWLDTYKPFGLEVIEIRYGGVMARLETLRDRLRDYCDRRIAGIPEFETTLLPFVAERGALSHQVGSYRRIATPSRIL